MNYDGNKQPIIMNGFRFKKNPMADYAKSLLETFQDIKRTNGNLDIMSEGKRFYNDEGAKQAVKRFITEDTLDANAMSYMTADEIESYHEGISQMFENDIKGLHEHSRANEYIPIQGIVPPIHQLIMMNTIFDKGGAIEKMVATTPAFTVSTEHRYLVTPDGHEIDMVKDQKLIADAMNATVPPKKFRMTLPENETHDLVTRLGGSVIDNLSVSTFISAIGITNGCYVAVGDKIPTEANNWEPKESDEVALVDTPIQYWKNAKITFHSSYGDNIEKTATEKVTVKVKQMVGGSLAEVEISDTIFATMTKNKFNIMSNGVFDAVELTARLDPSAATRDMCSVKWKINTRQIVIDDGTPINTTISPEEIKDTQALWGVDQTAKILDMFKTALVEHKDMSIKNSLDLSFSRLDESSKAVGAFDFNPPTGSKYALTPQEWRHIMFQEYLDDIVTDLTQVLNDPNVVINVFGDPNTIRKITPKEYVYAAPANIGNVTLDYTQVIVNTNDRRIYQFFGTDKMRHSDDLIIILNPRGDTNRFIYRIYDYQLYVGDNIRNNANPALPAIHAFERYKFEEHQPVQGRVKIYNKRQSYARP